MYEGPAVTFMPQGPQGPWSDPGVSVFHAGNNNWWTANVCHARYTTRLPVSCRRLTCRKC